MGLQLRQEVEVHMWFLRQMLPWTFNEQNLDHEKVQDVEIECGKVMDVIRLSLSQRAELCPPAYSSPTNCLCRILTVIRCRSTRGTSNVCHLGHECLGLFQQ